jgi:hypothetical protein
MMPKWHILTSAVLSVIIFKVTGSFSAAAVCFAAGTVIDIDHVLDYYVYSGRLSLSVSEVGGFYPRFGKVFVFLHSYKLLLAEAVVAYLLQAQVLFIGAAVGFMGHLLLDTAGYGMKARSYFLVYRVFCGFRVERLCYGGCVR